MIYNYKECIKLFKNNYGLTIALKSKKIFKIKEGLYSTNKNPKPLEVFIKQNKNPIFTMESAYYYLGISDVIPDKYYIATDKDSFKYKKSNIKQYFINNGLVNVGVISYSYLNTKIRVYNKERMLIELIRYKNKLPFDYYKDIIKYYRNHINDIDVSLVLDYLESFPKRQMIIDILKSEVL